jgi:hypothetical protein
MAIGIISLLAMELRLWKNHWPSAKKYSPFSLGNFTLGFFIDTFRICLPDHLYEMWWKIRVKSIFPGENAGNERKGGFELR